MLVRSPAVPVTAQGDLLARRRVARLSGHRSASSMGTDHRALID